MSGAKLLRERLFRDEALRSVPLWIVVTALNTSVLFGFLALDQAREAGVPPSERVLVLVLWLAIAIYLLAGKVRARCRRIDLVLPVAARELWLSHFLASVLAGGLVLGASLGVLGLHQSLLRNLRGKPLLELHLGELAGLLAGGLLLALSVVHAFRPKVWRLPSDRKSWGLLTGVAVAVPVLLVALAGRPSLGAAVCLVAALAVAWGAWRELPPSFTLVPLAAQAATARASRSAAGGRRSRSAGSVLVPHRVSRARLWRLTFAVIHHVPPWQAFAPWILYAVMLFFGFLVAGGFGHWMPDEEVRLFNLPLGSYMLLAGTGLFLYQLYRLDPLPVSRRLIFAILTLPSLLVFCLGLGAGRLLLAGWTRHEPAVDYRVVPPYSWVEIDSGFMGVARDGVAPNLTAPWGESHRAWHRPLFRGSSLILYHPFATSEESSVDFEAWMTSRAIAAVYGAEIPFEEIRDRWFEIEGESIVGVRGGRLALRRTYPDLVPPPTPPETPILLTLSVVPWLLLVALLVSTLRGTVSLTRTRAVYWIVLGILLAMLIGQAVLSIAGLYSPAAAAGIFAVSMRGLAASPFLWLGSWLASLALIFASYLVAESSFRRAELPATTINCSFIDWERKH